jgi:hypothetical protein
MINVFAGKPNLVIALQDRGFLDSGITAMNTTIIHKLGNTPLTFNPNEELNAISSFEKDQPYVIYCSQNIDLTGIVENQIPAGIEITPGINVLANSLFAGIALQTISFATMGLDATKITDIVEVGQSFKSYVPGDSINAIEGTIEGMPYYGHALVDMDLSPYFIPPIVIPSDVETATDTYKYYGTEATTDKGYYNVPVRFFADEASLPTTGIENIVYVAKAESTSWYWDGAVYQPIGGGGGITTETDPTVPTLVKNIPVSADAATNKYLNWDGTQYVRKQVAYSELSSTPSIPTQYTDEMAQDATAALFSAGTHTGITFTYDDAGNKISATVFGLPGSVNVLQAIPSPGSTTGTGSLETISTYTLPANMLLASGDVLNIEVLFTTTGTDTKALDVQIDGTTITSLSAVTTAGVWMHKISLMRSSSTSAIRRAEVWRVLSFSAISQGTYGAVNWAANQVITVKGSSTVSGSVVVHSVKIILEKAP